MPDISIIAPAYKEAERIGFTMQAVSTALRNKTVAELIVVDDCSEDVTTDIANTYADAIRDDRLAIKVLRTKRRSGKALAANVGLRHADSPVCVFMDAHSIPGMGMFEDLANVLNRDPDVALAGPTFVSMLQSSHDEKLSGELQPFTPQSLVHPDVTELVKARNLGYGRGQHLVGYDLQLPWMPFKTGNFLHRLQVLPGGCHAIRTDMLRSTLSLGDECPGYDDGMAFPWGAEDAELSLRAWRLGYSVVSVPQAFMATEYRSGWHYGSIGAVGSLFNKLRLAAMYFSDALFERIVRHYQNHEHLGFVLTEMLRHTDTLTRRLLLEEHGNADMRDMMPVLREFGGIDIEHGGDRHIIHQHTSYYDHDRYDDYSEG